MERIKRPPAGEAFFFALLHRYLGHQVKSSLTQLRLFFFKILMVLLAFSASPAFAQWAREDFGKNRIQYRKFDWQLLSSQSIDLYFYTGGETLARTALEISEQEFRRISDLFGFTPYNKIKIFLCLSTNDRLMSNLGMGEWNLPAGGKTTFTKSIAEVAYEGSLSNLKKQIAAGIAQIMIRDMLFGGSLKEAIQNSYLLNLPDWFIGGAIRYASEGAGPEMEDFMKELAGRKKIRQPANFIGPESFLIGQSIWNFIGQRFGRSTVGNILNLTRILRNEEKAIVGTLGMPFSVFLRDWRLYYLQLPAGGLSQLPVQQQVGKNFLRKNYRNLCYSPDGDYLFYSCDWKGKFQVWRMEQKTGRTQVIFRGGSRFIQQNSEGEFPALIPLSSEQLLLAYPSRGYWHGIRMDYAGRNRRRINWFSGFHEVNSLRPSPDGKLLAVSGSLGAYSDIFLFQMSSGKMRRLTQDWYDDLDPFFSPDGDSLYFSSNRPTADSIQEKPALDYRRKLSIHQLSVKNPDAPWRMVHQSTGNLIKGCFLADGRMACLDDAGGTRNIRVLPSGGTASSQIYLSSSLFNITDFACSPDMQTICFASRSRQKPALFHTRFTELYFNSRTGIVPGGNPGPVRSTITDGKIDIRNYVFESEKGTETEVKVKEGKRREKARFKKENQLVAADIQGPFAYTPQMTANHLTTGLQIHPIPTWGLGSVVDFSMHDLFENHHINGGLTVFLSDLELRNNASYLEYQFLRNRIDLKVRADRRAVQNSALNQLFRQRDVLSQVGISASYPLSNALRVELNPFFQQARRAVFDIRNIGLGGEDRFQNYWGAAGNLVFDNSTRTGLNQLAGTRLMLRASYQFSPGGSNRNFGEIFADMRTYFPIHREVTLAVRASGGRFFGNSPKKYLLGGVDNWMFRDYHISRQKDDPLLGYRDDVLSLKSDETQSDWLFNRFCTNLRGYRINAAYGTGFMLLNAELRIPLVRYIYKGPVNSNFWRNFQVLIFGDMGSAWTGSGPWRKSNSLNTRTLNEGNFSVRVKSYENPYLSSYGFGIRTMVLGYFSRLDVVWPLQKDADRVSGSNPMDYRNSSRLMLSIGHDF